jgi:hypothetical protein
VSGVEQIRLQRGNLMEMHKHRLPYYLLVFAALMEFMIMTHLHNANQFMGFESGVWSLRDMSSTMLSILSWGATVCVVIAFVIFTVRLNPIGVFGILGLVALTELFWGKVLPSPQDRWDYGLVALGTAIIVLYAALREANFIENAKRKLRPLWHSAGTT